MEMFTKEIGKMIKHMAKESTVILTELATSVLGEKINSTERE